MHKVAIVGSRPPKRLASPAAWAAHLAFMEQVREYVRALPKGTIVVSGGAEGVDQTAEREAKACSLNVEIFYPRWDLHGKGAGFARNKLIVFNAHRVVAFWDGVSRGTQHTIAMAEQMGKPLEVIRPAAQEVEARG